MTFDLKNTKNPSGTSRQRGPTQITKQGDSKLLSSRVTGTPEFKSLVFREQTGFLNQLGPRRKGPSISGGRTAEKPGPPLDLSSRVLSPKGTSLII